MRTVSFVEHLEFDCKGSISSKAIEIADVDNDKVGVRELTVDSGPKVQTRSNLYK